MAYLALYRKYRPDSFNDVVGQDKVIKVISNAILNNKISHAYLFSGPRGTGKTTTAKIIAKMVNCEKLENGKPCDKCDSCLNISNSSDIIEIDAASNNGVDEIRELRDKINLVPSSCKYKVYIIDEVHMLTIQAFNALLKTLEEPPKHVIFILATTEYFKIPLTISSRCQKFQFTKINDVDIVHRLEVISKNENIRIESDALFEIARIADGGLRDAINLLDQLTTYQSDIIKISDVYKISGSVSYDDLSNLIVNILDNNNIDIINFIDDIDKNGKNLVKFVEEIILFLKDILIYKTTNNLTNIEKKNNLIINLSNRLDDIIIYNFINNLNELLINVKTVNYPSILLIVELLKMSNLFNKDKNINNLVNVDNELKDNMNITDNNLVNVSNVNVNKNDHSSINISDDIVKIRINNVLAGAKKDKLLNIKSNWNYLSNFIIDEEFSSIAGLLVDVNPIVCSDDYLMLECKYDAVADRINQLNEDITRLLNKIYNLNYKIVAISSERWLVERDKYLTNRKKGIVYTVKEEIINNNEIKNNNDSLNRLVEIVGEDLIEYK